MIVRQYRVNFNETEMINILYLLSEINNKAINLAEFGCFESIEDFQDCNEISNIAVKLFGILQNKFPVESTPQKGQNNEQE